MEMAKQSFLGWAVCLQIPSLSGQVLNPLCVRNAYRKDFPVVHSAHLLHSGEFSVPLQVGLCFASEHCILLRCGAVGLRRLIYALEILPDLVDPFADAHTGC